MGYLVTEFYLCNPIGNDCLKTYWDFPQLVDCHSATAMLASHLPGIILIKWDQQALYDKSYVILYETFEF